MRLKFSHNLNQILTMDLTDHSQGIAILAVFIVVCIYVLKDFLPLKDRSAGVSTQEEILKQLKQINFNISLGFILIMLVLLDLF